MGCRNFTGVIVGGKIKVAQYGQWDGIPEGQGITIIHFLKNELNREKFLKNLERVRFITEEELDKGYKDAGAEPISSCSKVLALTDEGIKKFNIEYPYINRDHGAKLLSMIQSAPENTDIELLNSLADDPNYGVDCEWAYILNLDTNTLKVYSVHRNLLLPETEKFLYLNLMSSFDINNPPLEKEFIRLCKVDKMTDKHWKIWYKKCEKEGEQVRDRKEKERSEKIKLQLEQLLAACIHD
jgi:hypothetical protein